MKPLGIYQLIEEALLMSESPLTCDDLFDRAEIKARHFIDLLIELEDVSGA